MGSIIKRVSKDGKSISYRLRLFIGRDAKTGKQLFRTETCTGTKEQARTRLRELEIQFEQGIVIEPSKMNLSDFIQKWLTEAAGHTRKQRTLDDLNALFKRYIKESNLGKLPVTKVTPLHIQEWINELAKRLNHQTVKNAMSVLKGAFKAAVKWRFVTHSPARDVDLPRKNEERTIRAMTVEQMGTLLRALESHPRGIVYIFALETGARPGEYIGLKWTDLDWNTGRVRIERTVMRPRGGGWKFDTPKTKKSRRTIPLSPQMLARLREHRTAILQARLLAGPNWQDNDLIFPNMYGNPLHGEDLSKNFKKIVEKAGLPSNFRLYDNRHSSATHLIANGVSPAVVAERLGHYVASCLWERVEEVALEKVFAFNPPARPESLLPRLIRLGH